MSSSARYTTQSPSTHMSWSLPSSPSRPGTGSATCSYCCRNKERSRICSGLAASDCSAATDAISRTTAAIASS